MLSCLTIRFCYDPGQDMMLISYCSQAARVTLVQCRVHVRTHVSVLTAAWSAVLSGHKSPWGG